MRTHIYHSMAGSWKVLSRGYRSSDQSFVRLLLLNGTIPLSQWTRQEKLVQHLSGAATYRFWYSVFLFHSTPLSSDWMQHAEAECDQASFPRENLQGYSSGTSL
jgi:hypothetical protein